MASTRVFVLRHKHIHQFMTTQVEGQDKPCVVGFSTKAQAMTLKTMMKKHVCVDTFDKKNLVRLCHQGYLNVLLYNKNGDFEVISKPDSVDVDQFRFMLETTFRYY